MRYIAEILICKPLGAVLVVLSLSAVFFFGVMFTVAEIIDYIIRHFLG